MRKRVGNSTGASRGEVPGDRRRPRRTVGDLDVAAAMPCAGQKVRVAAHRQIDAFPPGVEVVDAGRSRHRVGEVDVAEGAERRQRPEREIIRIKRDVKRPVPASHYCHSDHIHLLKMMILKKEKEILVQRKHLNQQSRKK